MSNREVMQQALDALEELDGLDTETECVTIDVGDVITAIRAALEQQQAEPVQETEAFGFVTVRRLSQRFENHHDQYQFYPAGQIPYLDNVDECHTVYSTPPQRQWVGLTDEQLDDIAVVARRGNLHDLRIAIESAHGIKEGT